MPNWNEVRSRFPALERGVYLNTATIGHLPSSATKALHDHLEARASSASVALMEWFADLERVRAKVASLVSAHSEDIAFVPSTSHALSILLSGIDWKPGDRIITFDDEFPNNTYAPALLTRQGVEFLELPYDQLDDHLDGRVRLVIASALNYVTGFRVPVRELRAKLHQFGSLLYLDATQGCGGLHLPMDEMQPDVMGVHGYKWLLSPPGAGFAYFRPSIRQWLEPNVVGWRSHHTWQDFDNLHHGMPAFSSTAERYEGYMPALPLFFAMEQSVDLMLELGPAETQARILYLADSARQVVESLGGTIENENTPILACRFPGQDSSDLSRALAVQNVFTSARHGCLRLSFHLYNNEADIAALSESLSSLLKTQRAAG